MANVFKSGSIKRAKKEEGRQSLLAAQTVEAGEAMAAKAQAAEMAGMEVYSMLGAPGTYELPGSGEQDPIGTPLGTSDGIFATEGALTEKSSTAKSLLRRQPQALAEGGSLAGPREGILDPKAYASKISQSASFRMQSRMTAEAEQLLAQKGPLWDQLENSTLGQIMEGAAVQQREAMRDIRNRAAKGGSARRQALNDAQQLLTAERATQMRVQQTWQANLALFDTVRNYASKVQQENVRFIDGLPMIRQSYTQTLASITELQMSGYNQASAMSMAGHEARQAAGDNNWLGQLVFGVVNTVGAYFGNKQGIFQGGITGYGSTAGQGATQSGGGGGGGLLDMAWGAGKKAAGAATAATLRKFGGEPTIEERMQEVPTDQLAAGLGIQSNTAGLWNS
jgi:hypothetical protein